MLYSSSKVKYPEYVQISEHFQTNQGLQHSQDSRPDIPSGLAASDRKLLQPMREKHSEGF